MSKRAVQDLNDTKFREAHAAIKAMRQKISQSKVALDRWDSAKNDVALKAAEAKWKNRIKGKILRAWHSAVRDIQREREEHRLNPPPVVKVDNSDQNFKKYGSMVEMVKKMKSRCGDATHILEVDHEAEHRNKLTNSDTQDLKKHKPYSSPERTHQDTEIYHHRDAITTIKNDAATQVSPLSELSQRIYRETRQRDVDLQNTYHLPSPHFESPSSYRHEAHIRNDSHRTSSPHHLHYQQQDHDDGSYAHHYHDEYHPTPRHASPSNHYGLTPQAPALTMTFRQPTATKTTTVKPVMRQPISVNFYRPVRSPDRSIPTWLKYKHVDY
jgi:hypothetical protein